MLEFKCSNDHRASRFDDPIKYPVPDYADWQYEYHSKTYAQTGYITTTVQCPECGAEVKIRVQSNRENRELVNG